MKKFLIFAFLLFSVNLMSQDMYDYTKEFVILDGKYVQLDIFNDIVKIGKERTLAPHTYIVNRKINTVLVAAYTTLAGRYIAVPNLRSVEWSRQNDKVKFEYMDGTIQTETYLVKEVLDSIDVTNPLNGITQSGTNDVRILTWSMNFDDFHNVYPDVEIIK